MNQKLLKQYNLSDIEKQISEENQWVIIDDQILNVNNFDHPAGKNIMKAWIGKDASQIFKFFHPQNTLEKFDHLIVGKIIPQKQQIKKQKQIEYYSTLGLRSPYYNNSHFILRDKIRQFCEIQFKDYEQWDDQGQVPLQIIKNCAEFGFLALCVGTPWPTQWFPKQEVCQVVLEKPDSFHELVLYEELNRFGSGGVSWAILLGTSVGLPPIIKFGNQQLQNKIIPACLRGEKIICLAITEPYAGSDVANIQTTAVLQDKVYTVNGMKKWITNGLFCDYFTTAVRIRGKISLLLIDKSMKGVYVRKIKCQGMWSSGTSFLIFDNVQVPIGNLIGEEGQGFKYIVINFNHERLTLSMQSVRLARVCYDETMKFVNNKYFNQIQNPSIRNKMANMNRQLESITPTPTPFPNPTPNKGVHAYLEQCCYNYDVMSTEQKNKQLSGAIALLKVQATQVLDLCAREAIHIFKLLGYTRKGIGEKIERIQREIKGLAIPGGSEEIMLDFSMRQASNLMPYL